jgi:hypothetical protein
MNITLEQRNAKKLYNLLEVANQNVQNRDIYFYLKYYVKTMINQLRMSQKDYEILSGHVNAFSNELASSHWELRQLDPQKYDKFLNDFYNKVDFKKISIEFMFKCKDILEISPVKNDLYRRRMEFFDKKLPKISQFSNTTNTSMQNNNMNFNNNNYMGNNNNYMGNNNNNMMSNNQNIPNDNNMNLMPNNQNFQNINNQNNPNFYNNNNNGNNGSHINIEVHNDNNYNNQNNNIPNAMINNQNENNNNYYNNNENLN